MNLIEAKHLAITLMKEHNLVGWSFNFNSRKRAYGLCNYSKRCIFLSKHLTPHMNIDQVRNTLLHEIAHALVGSGHGHNAIWKRKAKQIGCTGDRCSNHGVGNKITAKYEADCPVCGTSFKVHRRPKRDHWCRCTNRTFKSNEKLIYVQQY